MESYDAIALSCYSVEFQQKFDFSLFLLKKSVLSQCFSILCSFQDRNLQQTALAFPQTVLHVQRRTVFGQTEMWRQWKHGMGDGSSGSVARQRSYAQSAGCYLCSHLQRRARELWAGVEDGDVLVVEGLRGKNYSTSASLTHRNCRAISSSYPSQVSSIC